MSIIKSFSVGNGDMFCIRHGTDNFTVIDCCNSSEENRKRVFREIASSKSGKTIDRFISTHPDDDHIRGLVGFVEEFGIANFYCVKNEVHKDEETEDFKRYCLLRENAFFLESGCKRKWLNKDGEGRGNSGINFLWPVVDNPHYVEVLAKAKKGKECNNISPIFTYSMRGGVVAMWMGDMEKDFTEKIKDDVEWPEIDILFAPHHGRDSGKVPEDVLARLHPSLIVVGEAPSKDLNYYPQWPTITQNRAGDITFDCLDGYVNVYVSNRHYKPADGVLMSKSVRKNTSLGHFLGCIKTKN